MTILATDEHTADTNLPTPHLPNSPILEMDWVGSLPNNGSP